MGERRAACGACADRVHDQLGLKDGDDARIRVDDDRERFARPQKNGFVRHADAFALNAGNHNAAVV